ncbi:hypothetical protein DYU11_21055 [Fibrisoma montanum]|uniref:Uncharacterized protein n=1 Tax=Fibrisoma montanum TaxID=2305895 RepID=A0A418M3Y4_9BACT|nr:hypothetical protein [Fibrisoma montanum]RIV20536.1 hypothetical protein DYU11_21055 [Fibrisoma montanum]
MDLKPDLITIDLDDEDEPVLIFTHKEVSPDIEQKLLGAFVRKVARQGVELHLVKRYPDANDTDKPNWVYHLRAKRDE